MADVATPADEPTTDGPGIDEAVPEPALEPSTGERSLPDQGDRRRSGLPVAADDDLPDSDRWLVTRTRAANRRTNDN